MSIGLIMVKMISGFLALILCMKWTGAKGVSNLTPIDFIWSIMLSEIFGNGLYDPQVKWYVVLLTIVVWCGLKVLFDNILYRTDKVERILTGEHQLIILDGEPIEDRLRKNRVDSRDLGEALRKQGIFSIEEVKRAYLEKDGSLTVQLKEFAEPVTKGDLKIEG
ncbi:DUF421 domain-containing protein [Edaphobacillus lindanitolerans]|uniref:Uncharacterized membrane protein YcaP, DUF421 family n=1 Tax=Edaphobacillus lindanitolerans TaxID=550447 RepID=A0A1U7PL30_9BACI|nr:YetF domain-containing protein [Edaphobacillus lindanitolerans]SIT87221.1 Uncharacterized membrane protein YcaP, DUF421 family [Edaphobacillus lindanitolerans]